ncbi:hypothetical protein COU77_02800 [Candidatus Peregrinibacteria bacterium CG10_big_fil_rev_8_21_14_0_10_49_16]|nr:MAG: hypothetical protein COW95_02315 [Candidatus Peregrinibacteria bacterium CG22_combo_CG10-13_8_21_14_all_49_11]PIR51967.1 MAG: hypothetical protein COU77_02800 [Candidatus Peregrinibacteria bacterium CG10_big_fil_rev_8_21_14_0_10_49_16]
MSTPSIAHRALKTRNQKNQSGTIISYTTITQSQSHTIALIELEDGSRVLGQIVCHSEQNMLSATALIGQRVMPRMALSSITEQGLRIYDISYEVIIQKKIDTFDESVFPRYILAITGPSGVGKSTVSKLLGTVCSHSMTRVPILTTRHPKEGDDGEYTYVSQKEFEKLHKEGKLAAYTDIPSNSEERRYGYVVEDLERIWENGKVPVVVTEMHLLQGLAQHFGRRSILSFGLLPPGKSRRAMLSSLLFRLRKRGRETEAQIRERLKHAVQDLQFFKERAELFDHILVNEDLDTLIKTFQKHALETV